MASVLIALEQKSLFEQTPPAGWRLNPATNRITCEDDSVIVLTNDNRFEGRSPCFQIDCHEKLEILRYELQNKPILLTVKCSKDYNASRMRDEDSNQESEYHTHIVEYVALIHTRHPEILEILNEALRRAEGYLKGGKKFRVTVDFSSSIRIWFMHNVPLTGENKESTQTWGANIYFTCGVDEPTIADRCFNCESLPQKVFWIACFPFFFLCFLPHWVYKKYILGLEEYKISKPLPVALHVGPFQMGFNLFHLFYPPGATITSITNIHQPAQQQAAYQPLQQNIAYQNSGQVGYQTYQQTPSGYQPVSLAYQYSQQPQGRGY